MDYGDYMNPRLHGWAFAKIHSQVQYKAAEEGIPVETVNPRDTSKTCNECGEIGSRSQQAEFRCTNEECWVSEYQADINGRSISQIATLPERVIPERTPIRVRRWMMMTRAGTGPV